MKELKIKSAMALAILLSPFFILLSSCSDDDEEVAQEQYGYVQFKLYKSASFETKTVKSRAEGGMDYLSEATKIEVVMQHEGATIRQTLVLSAYNTENAEYGLRSDKLKLLVGNYEMIGYYLYDANDRKLLEAGMENGGFSIVGGGLVVKEVPVDVTPRGMVSFKLIKNMVSTRAAEGGSYPFGNIRVVDIMVKNVATREVVTVEKVPVEYTEDFREGSLDETLYPDQNAETSYALCDTVVWLKAGTYTISGYTTYSDKKGTTRLETASVSQENTFVVEDNKETKEVEVPIALSETAEYIKDYLALKEIWEAMDGKNWSYYGEAEAIGANWYFNKDIDLWGEQPGVQLDGDGRVVSLVLSGFGAKGCVPDAIGQLSELAILYLGAHDEKLGGYLADQAKPGMTAEEKQAIRLDYDNKFLARDVREGLSDILQEAINRNPQETPIRQKSRIELKDVQWGGLTSGITGISKAMMRLTNLEQFYIANAPVTREGFFREIQPESPFYAEREKLSWSNLTGLTDVEIYNCPNLEGLPVEMLTGLPEIAMLNIACNKSITGEQLKKDWEAIIDGASGGKIQVLYMGYNNLKEFPEYEYLKRMERLGLLDCVYNEIETLHPFGKEINFSKIYLDNNKIKEIPNVDGYFFGYAGDLESFTCSNNQLTEFPDIFNAKSIYTMGSIDFSYNQISKFENGENHRGVNAATLNLSNNRLETFPSILFKKNSPISTLNLAGNGMTTIPDNSMEGKYAYRLVTLDLSYNKLTKLSNDFYPETMPYLYGIDLSYNCFSNFPYAPLNIKGLTTFGIRHQRDANGNRTLREWPTGLYTCPSLVGFYIGSNDLRKIEDTISPYIRIFEIKDNPNISIDLSSVCDYISIGYYLLIYDRTQDIRGCDLLDLEN